MKTRGIASQATTSLLCICLILFSALCASADTQKDSGPDPTRICAKVLELHGDVELQPAGDEGRPVQAGDMLSHGDTITLTAGSWVTVAMKDGTVRKLGGPGTVTVEHKMAKKRENIVARLSASVMNLLFTPGAEASEAGMATRGPSASELPSSRVPVLVHPAPNSRLLSAPEVFRWRAVDGIPLYRVMLFDSKDLLWNDVTERASTAFPKGVSDLKPAESYFWVVEGMIGDSSFRSATGEFMVVSESEARSFKAAMDEIDSSCNDPAFATLVKVRMCLDSGMLDEAGHVLEAHYGKGKLDGRGYMLRAEISERKGLLEEALQDYKLAARLGLQQ